MKDGPVGAEFYAGGRTDRQNKLMADFRNFTNAPKNSTFRPPSAFMC